MRHSRLITASISLFVLLLSITWIPEARADGFDRKTVFTTNQPVRIPGNKVLPAGKYVLKLVDATTRNVVRILDSTETKVYSTFIAMPGESPNAISEPRLSLAESTGSLFQLKSWHYPGYSVGLEFPSVVPEPLQERINSN